MVTCGRLAIGPSGIDQSSHRLKHLNEKSRRGDAEDKKAARAVLDGLILRAQAKMLSETEVK